LGCHGDTATPVPTIDAVTGKDLRPPWAPRVLPRELSYLLSLLSRSGKIDLRLGPSAEAAEVLRVLLDSHTGPPFASVRSAVSPGSKGRRLPVKHESRQRGFTFLAACVAALGLVAGGIADASTPLHPLTLDHRAGGYRPGVDYRVKGYLPKSVPPEELIDYKNSITPLADPGRLLDGQGVALFRYNGHNVYHPLLIARYGLDLLHNYRITTTATGSLARAEVNANFLIDHAVSRDGALYFAYRFTYRNGGQRNDLMRPPWFSALAQGTALILFMRLYAVTGDEHWRTAADSTFATFEKRRSATKPWTVFVAHRFNFRYLWLEEAPKNPPSQVLNGHLYALFGVWEYALATGSAAAVAVFDGAATTIRYQLHRFRVPGGISYYALRIRQQNPAYHCVHVQQLKILGRMTGDPWFAREARRFAADGRRAHVGC
jgi:D-glucuronyl C5-epimerase C-terminus